MSVTIDVVREEFAGDGVSTEFPTTLLVMAADEIRVFVLDEPTPTTAVRTELLPGIGFTALLNTPDTLPSTLTVDISLAFPSGLPADHRLFVVREHDLIQDESFSGGSRFPETAVERVLDRVTLQAQFAKYLAKRAFVIPVEDGDLDTEMPRAADRANKVLLCDALGLPSFVELSEISPGAIILSALSQTLLPSNSIVTWRSTLEALAMYGALQGIGAGTEAARPAASAQPFTLYFATNTFRIFYSNGTTWTEIGIVQGTAAEIAAAANNNGRIFLDHEQGVFYRGNGSSKNLLRALPPKHLAGAKMTWSSISAMSVAAAWARDEADALNMRLASSMSKTMNTGGSWTAGAAGNAAPAGALFAANTLYGVFLIGKPDGTCDWGIDTILTAANLLAAATGYTGYRRIGWIRSNATPNLVAWNQNGDEFTWQTPQLGYADGADVDYTAATSRTIDYAPPDTVIHGAIHFLVASDGDRLTWAHTGQTIGAVTVGAVAPGAKFSRQGFTESAPFDQETDSFSQVKFRSGGTNTTRITVVVYGWTDPRGRTA